MLEGGGVRSKEKAAAKGVERRGGGGLEGWAAGGGGLVVVKTNAGDYSGLLKCARSGEARAALHAPNKRRLLTPDSGIGGGGAGASFHVQLDGARGRALPIRDGRPDRTGAVRRAPRLPRFHCLAAPRHVSRNPEAPNRLLWKRHCKCG